MSVLFGTASEIDVKLIKQKLANLKMNQKELAQFIKKSVSVLNVIQSV